MEQKKIKLLIDTDIGGDVDDALALGHFLNSRGLAYGGGAKVLFLKYWWG